MPGKCQVLMYVLFSRISILYLIPLRLWASDKSEIIQQEVTESGSVQLLRSPALGYDSMPKSYLVQLSEGVPYVSAPMLFPVAFNLVKSFMSEDTRKKILILGGECFSLRLSLCLPGTQRPKVKVHFSPAHPFLKDTLISFLGAFAPSKKRCQSQIMVWVATKALGCPQE